MTRQKEQKAWDTFSRGIDQRELKALRIENLYSGDGMPDVLCINRQATVFWIENKALEDWPARESTRPMRESFEPGQLGFGRMWKAWNGLSFVLLRVGTRYFLLDPDDPLDMMTQEEILSNCLVEGKNDIIAYLERLKKDEN
jgi:hypothetical protein